MQERILLHGFADTVDHGCNDQGCKSETPIEEKHEDHKKRRREKIAHQVRQNRHHVFLDKNHICGENGADASYVAFGEKAHGQTSQMLAKLFPQISQHFKTST